MIRMRRYYSSRSKHVNDRKFFPPGKFGHIGKAVEQLMKSGGTLTVYTYYRKPFYYPVDITAKWLFPSDDLVRITIGTSVRKYQVRVTEG